MFAPLRLLLGVLGVSLLATFLVGSQAAPADLGEFLVHASGRDRGLCLNLNDADGKLTVALARASGLCVQGCTRDGTTLAVSRARIAEASLDDRATVIRVTSDGLPHADNLVNVVVCDSWRDSKVSLDEVLRVLAPGGVGLVRTEPADRLEEQLRQAGVKDVQRLARPDWLRFVKPIDPGLAGWTHRLAGPNLTSVNDDQRVAPWSELRWIGEPRWGALYLTYLGSVTDGGRYFYKENRAAANGMSQTWLAARDAYNGFELWRVPAGPPFKTSYYFLDDTLTCDAQAVYSVEGDVLTARDGATGKKLREFAPGFLPTTVTVSGEVVLAGSKTKAAALDRATGKVLWSRPVRAHPCVEQGRCFVLGPTDLEAVDLVSGKSLWQIAALSDKGNPLLCVRDGVVYVSFKPTWAPTTLLTAYDAAAGRLLWKQESPKGGYGMLPYRGELLLLDRENGARGDNVTVRALNPRTGEQKREFLAKGLASGHCFTSKGCGNYLVYSSSWYMERESGKTFEPNTVRGACRLGQMPANGLTYFLPQHCDCKVVLRGFLAMASAGNKKWPVDAAPVPTVLAEVPSAPPSRADDWPIYRHDTRRSNATSTELPEQLDLLWTEKLGRSPLTQAVTAGGVLVTTEPRTGRVFGRDAADGKPLWTYHADGKVEAPPALHRGLCFLGTNAGTVVALDARTGKEVWRLRAAPAEKYIAEEGRFASAWPIVGGVMPLGDVVYFNCGRANNVDGGLHLFAVEATTGKVRWRVAAGSSGDLFTSDGKDLMLTKTFYRTTDGTRIGGAKLSTGLLHTTQYLSPVAVLDYMASVEPALTSQRHIELTDGQVTGEALAFNDRVGVAAWRYRFGVPAAMMKKDRQNQRFIYASSEKKVQWLLDEDIRQQMVGVVLGGDTAYLAGVPTSLDAKDRCELWGLNVADGKKRFVLPLEGRPVYDGLSAASGRLYLATEEGTLLCFGKR